MNQNLNVYAARDAAYAGRPFVVRAEFHGSNWENQSCRSDKFWLIECTTPGGAIHIRYGKTGAIGATIACKGAYDAFHRLGEKQDKGYKITKVAVTPDRPSITKAPAPFNEIREIRAHADGIREALDANGLRVALLSTKAADEILATYNLPLLATA